jgi:predicted secreted protein
MTKHLAEAQRLMESRSSPLGVQIAGVHALIALAESSARQAVALESILSKLEGLTDDDRGTVLRVEVVPR